MESSPINLDGTLWVYIGHDNGTGEKHRVIGSTRDHVVTSSMEFASHGHSWSGSRPEFLATFKMVNC